MKTSRLSDLRTEDPGPRATASPSDPLFDKLALLGSSTLMRRLRAQIKAVAPHLRALLLVAKQESSARAVARELHAQAGHEGLPLRLVTAEALNKVARSHASGAELLRVLLNGPAYVAGVERLSSASQEQLLRALDSRERSGPLWLVASSDRPLHGKPYDDVTAALAQRLTHVTLTVPTIRDRPEDVRELIEFIMDNRSDAAGQRTHLEDEAHTLLQDHDWPGDLSELMDVLSRIASKTVGESLIRAADVRSAFVSTAVQTELKRVDPGTPVRLQEVIDQHVLAVLRQCEGNKLRAAEVLDVSRSTLYRMLGATVATGEAAVPRSRSGTLVASSA